MLDLFHHPLLHEFLANYGPWAVMVVVMLESMGVPLPGETMVVSAALYAGATGRVSIYWIVLAASSGAILGDNFGYWIGRELGLPLLVKYGPRVNLTGGRLRLGQYLFRRFGSFFGRFVALLRTFAALLAGANHFSWERFLIFNALGGICWASIFGFGAYGLGQSFEKIKGPFALVAFGTALVGVVALVLFLRHHEGRLLKEAEDAMPGPEQVD